MNVHILWLTDIFRKYLKVDSLNQLVKMLSFLKFPKLLRNQTFDIEILRLPREINFHNVLHYYKKF